MHTPEPLFTSSTRVPRTSLLICDVSLYVALVLGSWSTLASMPRSVVEVGDFYGDKEVEVCNYFKGRIDETEWLFTAAHCIGDKTIKDISFIYGKDLNSRGVKYSFRSLPMLYFVDPSFSIEGEMVYMNGVLESNDWGKLSIHFSSTARYNVVVDRFEMKVPVDIQKKIEIFTGKVSGAWKGISGSPIFLEKNDHVVGIITDATVSWGSLFFSGPQNIGALINAVRTRMKSEK